MTIHAYLQILAKQRRGKVQIGWFETKDSGANLDPYLGI